jgi:hypothetical protein
MSIFPSGNDVIDSEIDDITYCRGGQYMISGILSLKHIVISPMNAHVGRKRINEEQMPARFPAGTLARIDTVLAEGEKRADLLREAVRRELERRERKPPHLPRGKR